MTTGTEEGDSLAWRVAREMLSNDQFSQGMGMEILDAGRGTAVMAMTLKPHHCNGFGNAHGGAIFGLADTAFAHACNARNAATVAQFNTIAYLRPGMLGDRLLATARETARAGRSGIYEIQVTRESDGKIIAEFRGHSRTIDGKVLPEEEIDP